MHTSTLSLATSMPTTTRSSCAIIHSLPCLVRAQRPLQLFGLRKAPELSLALEQALSLLGRNGLSSSNGRFFHNRPFAHSARFPGHKGRIAIVTDVGLGMRWTRQRQARRSNGAQDE